MRSVWGIEHGEVSKAFSLKPLRAAKGLGDQSRIKAMASGTKDFLGTGHGHEVKSVVPGGKDPGFTRRQAGANATWNKMKGIKQ